MIRPLLSLVAPLAQGPADTVPKPALPAVAEMQPFGWVFLVVSVGFVVILVTWCFYRVLTAPPDGHTVEPPDSLGG